MTDQADFQQLSDRYLNAVGAKDGTAAESALTALEGLRDRAADVDLQNKINIFIVNAGAGQLAAAVAARAAVTSQVSDLAAAFDGAAAAAKKAEKDLFFNKLSETLGGIEKTITAFKARAGEIKAALESLNKPGDVQGVLDNVETVKGILDGLKSDLQSIKNNFQG